jgi:hypothetical protein
MLTSSASEIMAIGGPTPKECALIRIISIYPFMSGFHSIPGTNEDVVLHLSEFIKKYGYF